MAVQVFLTILSTRALIMYFCFMDALMLASNGIFFILTTMLCWRMIQHFFPTSFKVVPTI